MRTIGVILAFAWVAAFVDSALATPWLVYKTSARLAGNSCAAVPYPIDQLHTFPGKTMPSAASTADDPAWSPNGRWIAFSSGTPRCTNADGVVRDSARIWVVERTGRNPRSVTVRNQATGGPVDASPSWSPDGRQIAFTRFDSRLGAGGIYVVGFDGRGLRRFSSRRFAAAPSFGRQFDVVDDPLPSAVSLDWSPDGRTIAFVPGENLGASYSAANRVVMFDIRTRSLVAVRLSEPYDLAWSPNGKAIAVTTRRAIVLLDRRGKLLRTITVAGRGPQMLDGVTWSPDSRRLAYGLGGTIFSVGLDGRGASRIVAGAAPDWRP